MTSLLSSMWDETIAFSTCACCSAGQWRDRASQKKKKKTTAMGWSRSGRFALRSQTLLPKRIFQQQHALVRRFGEGQTGTATISIFKVPDRVESALCSKLRAGSEKALQCRQFIENGAGVRTFRRTDVLRYLTFCAATHILHRTNLDKLTETLMMSVIWGSLIFIATRDALQWLKHSRPPASVFNIIPTVFFNFFKAVQALNIMQAHNHNCRLHVI